VQFFKQVGEPCGLIVSPQLYRMEDELLEIADDATNDWIERNDPDNPGWHVNGEHIQRSRVRIDTRK
jgi:hypothetical protein